jgi:transcriptional regulator with XRE-family HTH domain
MPSSLGSELQAHRKKRGLTQKAVSEMLGVQRPTLAQWETDKHLPSPEHIHRLDEIYGARGALVALAQAVRTGDEPAAPPQRHESVADVFRHVADALVALISPGTDGARPGWAHNLVARTPTTPLSTAFVIRTLQMVDDAQVDLHALGRALVARKGDGGWTNRSVLDGSPEVTAVVLAALARLGLLSDVDGSIEQLERGIDNFALSRPYILAVVLEALLAIRPDAPLVGRLVDALLDARKPDGDRLVWPANAAAPAGLVEPSPAHTARAAAVLRLALPYVQRPGLDDAVTAAVDWIVERKLADHGVSELLEPVPGVKAADITINHFTAAWCVRALAGADGVPARRLQDALDILWSCYSPEHRLWVWRSDGKFPSWMTHDAVAALRAVALTGVSTPVILTPETSSDSHPGDT